MCRRARVCLCSRFWPSVHVSGGGRVRKQDGPRSRARVLLSVARLTPRSPQTRLSRLAARRQARTSRLRRATSRRRWPAASRAWCWCMPARATPARPALFQRKRGLRARIEERASEPLARGTYVRRGRLLLCSRAVPLAATGLNCHWQAPAHLQQRKARHTLDAHRLLSSLVPRASFSNVDDSFLLPASLVFAIKARCDFKANACPPGGGPTGTAGGYAQRA